MLFGEGQSRIVVSLSRSRLAELRRLAARKKVRLSVLGAVGGRAIAVRRAGRTIIRVPVNRLEKAWEQAIPRVFSIR